MQAEAVDHSGAQVEAQCQFERGQSLLGCIATAAPHVHQGVGQAHRRAVFEVDRAELREQRQVKRVGQQSTLEGRRQHLLQQGGGLLGKALGQARLGYLQAQRSGGLGQFVAGCVWIGQKGKNQGLDKHGPIEFAFALDKVGRASQSCGDGVEHVVQGGCYLRYDRHWKAPVHHGFGKNSMMPQVLSFCFCLP